MKLSKFFVATGFYPPPIRFANHEFDEVLKVAIIPYDAASMGGALGARRLPGIFPVGAVLCGGFYEVLDAPVSATNIGTIALEIGAGVANLLAATLISALTPFGEYLIPADDPTEYYKITQADADTHKDQLKLTVAAEAITAGRINFTLYYVMSRDNFRFEGPVLPLVV